MKTEIKHITVIQTGLFAKPKRTGDVVYFQAKHFDEDGFLLSSFHPDLIDNEFSEKHLLQNGDVLFSAKGTKNFAVVYENFAQPAVASTSFFVVRLTDRNTLPGYLAWFLNSPATQAKLKAQAIGTSIPSISKQVLENLEIDIPNIETQNLILRIRNLRFKEISLKKEIEELREKQIQQQIQNAIK